MPFRISPFDSIVRVFGVAYCVVPTADGLYVNEAGDRFHVYRGKVCGSWFDASLALSPNEATDVDEVLLARMGLTFSFPEPDIDLQAVYNYSPSNWTI